PVGGVIHVHALSDLAAARLTPESRDRLIAGEGKVAIELTGADFEFVQKLTLKNPRERYAAPAPVNFTLPSGLRGGAQPKLEAEIDTRELAAGDYKLQLTQVDGKAHETTLKVLPPVPQLGNSPVRLNLGERTQRVTLHGTGLSRVLRIGMDDGPQKIQIKLGPPAGDSQRDITATLGDHARKDDQLSFRATVENMDAPIVWKDAAEVVGPRPRIDHVRTSLPSDLEVGLRAGELPSGAFVSFVLDARDFAPSATLSIACASQNLTLHPLNIHVGEQNAGATLRRATPESLFLSFDPGAVGQSGCKLEASLENEIEGRSDAKPLGVVVRLPRIESFQLTDEKAGATNYAAILRGKDLELIAKAGWDDKIGVVVEALPVPIAGETMRQSLRIALQWPAPEPHAPLYIWLRGETAGRPTDAKF
ncbi:MAG: hypothetical protein ABI165_12895, partial [Bryobacteraceae bacterium]